MFGTRDNWRHLCAAEDLSVRRGARIRVNFANGRSHDVQVHSTDDGYLITAVVAGPDAVRQIENPYEAVWVRNRRSRLVGFRIDDDGTLTAHGWTPRDGLTAEAFQLLVRTVGREADRYEFQLTGADAR